MHLKFYSLHISFRLKKNAYFSYPFQFVQNSLTPWVRRWCHKVSPPFAIKVDGTIFVVAKNSLMWNSDLSYTLVVFPLSTTDLADYKVVRFEHELQLIKADHRMHTHSWWAPDMNYSFLKKRNVLQIVIKNLHTLKCTVCRAN